MSRGTNQKFKFTYLMKIMLAKTDDEHALTMPQIMDELEKYDVTAERKSIYADFQDMTDKFGIEIIKEQIGRETYYHVGSREFAAAGVEGTPSRLVGMGGGVTTISAVKHRMNVYDADVIQGSVLTRTDILQQMEDYAGRTLAQRIEMPGLQPKRADVILAAACILNVITERLGCEQLTVSDRGLRHGLAYELFHGTEQRK